MLTPQELVEARTLRLSERSAYLAANKSLPDAPQRWRAYETSILTKYGDLPQTAHTSHYQLALDVAWVRRDRRYQGKHMQETHPPTSDHT